MYPWQEVDIVKTTTLAYENPYTDVDVHVDFTHENDTTLRRPAFWDGGQTWKVRFASPLAEGRWHWHSQSSTDDSGLDGQGGTLDCEPDLQTAHRFYKHGFWRMSPGKRSLVLADGYPAILARTPLGAFPGARRKNNAVSMLKIATGRGSMSS